MIEINQYGILPSGIHDISLDEIGLLFGGVSNSRHRSRLFEELKKYVERLRALRIGVALIVDGSFVMPYVEMPADIDLLLVMPGNWERAIEKIPTEYYNLLSPVRVETEFAEVHLFVVAENSWEYHDWIHYFSNIRAYWKFRFNIPQDVSKGLIRVTL